MILGPIQGNGQFYDVEHCPTTVLWAQFLIVVSEDPFANSSFVDPLCHPEICQQLTWSWSRSDKGHLMCQPNTVIPTRFGLSMIDVKIYVKIALRKT
jgi:hypothetical protein